MERYNGILNRSIVDCSDLMTGNDEMFAYFAYFNQDYLVWDTQDKRFVEWVDTGIGYGRTLKNRVTEEKLKKTLEVISEYIGRLDSDNFAEFSDGQVQYVNAVLNYSFNPILSYFLKDVAKIDELKKAVRKTILDKVNEGDFSESEKNRILGKYGIKEEYSAEGRNLGIRQERKQREK